METKVGFQEGIGEKAETDSGLPSTRQKGGTIVKSGQVKVENFQRLVDSSAEHSGIEISLRKEDGVVQEVLINCDCGRKSRLLLEYGKNTEEGEEDGL